jgi:hypothetical protein
MVASRCAMVGAIAGVGVERTFSSA